MKTSKEIIKILQSDGNVSTNKSIMFALGTNEAIVYSELLSRHSYFQERNQLQNDGSFFNTIFDLYLGTSLAEKAQRTAIKNLEKKGLLKCKVKGIPARRFFYMNLNINMEELIKEGDKIIEELKQKYLSTLVNNPVTPKGETSLPLEKELDTPMEEASLPLEKELDASEVGCNNTNNNTNSIIPTNNYGGENVFKYLEESAATKKDFKNYKKPNKFTDYPQRQYDYNDLESKLLGNSITDEIPIKKEEAVSTHYNDLFNNIINS